MKVTSMSASADTDVVVIVEQATRIGARPFKNATGDWAFSVEVALLDTILSIGAHVDDVFGAGVLPRLRAFKAFRGPADMMRVIATLGPFGLADFVPEQHQIDRLMTAAGQLLDAGIETSSDVDPASVTQRQALISADGVPELAWPYFLIALGHKTPELVATRDTWLDQFLHRTTGARTEEPHQRDALLHDAAGELDQIHQRKSYGVMPAFTVSQLEQAIFRSEYARITTAH